MKIRVMIRTSISKGAKAGRPKRPKVTMTTNKYKMFKKAMKSRRKRARKSERRKSKKKGSRKWRSLRKSSLRSSFLMISPSQIQRPSSHKRIKN